MVKLKSIKAKFLISSLLMVLSVISAIHLLELTFAASLLLTIPAALVMWVVCKRLTAHFNTIIRGMDIIRHGNFSYRLEVHGDHEFASFAKKFNEMGERLERIMTEVEVSQFEMEREFAQRSKAINTANERLKRAMDELKYSQREIIQAETQKSLTSIVSGFAHEINNPLTGILGYIDLMELNEAGSLSPYSKMRLEAIKDQALRIKDIIEQLNQLDPEVEQTKTDIDLSNLLEKMVKIIRRNESGKGVTLDTGLMQKDSIVQGNHFALWQVFEGIIENAVESIIQRNVPEGKIQVSVRVNSNRKTVIIEIADNGGGFEDIDRAFSPFYTTKSRTQKRGIGLFVAFNIIQDHKGTINIRNKGEGAVVTIHMPLDRKTPESPKEKQNKEKKAWQEDKLLQSIK